MAAPPLVIKLESRRECDRLNVAVSYSPGLLIPYTGDPALLRNVPVALDRKVPL
jgi:hypothetical protein